MKHSSDKPSVCSIIEIDPGPKRVCNLNGDDRMEVRATLNCYFKNPHPQAQSLHPTLTDATTFPYLGEPPWKEVLWIGKSERVSSQNRKRRQVGANNCKLFLISGQKYYHIPFMEWVMKKLFKMSGPDPGGDEYMEKGVQVYIRHPD